MILAREGRDMATDVHVLPEEIDQEIAHLKLESMGLGIDSLTEEQITYRDAYAEGT